MRGAADAARRRVADRSRLRLGKRDQLGERARRDVRVDDDHVRTDAVLPDRGEILVRVVRDLRADQVGIDRHRAGRADADRVAVGRRLRDRVEADRAAGAGPVLDDDRLAEQLGERRRDQARVQVDGAARGERRDRRGSAWRATPVRRLRPPRPAASRPASDFTGLWMRIGSPRGPRPSAVSSLSTISSTWRSVDDVRRREQHMIAALAVGGAARRIADEAAAQRRRAQIDSAIRDARAKRQPCVARSSTSSSARNRPRPRMSPTCGCAPKRSSSAARSRLPCARTLSSRRSRSMQSSTASGTRARDGMAHVGVAVGERARALLRARATTRSLAIVAPIGR